MIQYKKNVLNQLITYCAQKLQSSKLHLEYFFMRGLDSQIINKFKLGYFPLCLGEIFEVCDPKVLKELGIVESATYSRFFDRVIFPIYNVYGEVVAIAGRYIDDVRKPKYINSVYNKMFTLYGLNFVKDEIRQKDFVFVVEGYFDFLTAFKNGIFNVVATCSATLSLYHFILLSRYASTIYLLFDNDKAGEDACLRAMKFRDKYETNVVTLKFPQSIKDIDNFFQYYSLDDFYKLVYNYKERIRNDYLQRLKVKV